MRVFLAVALAVVLVGGVAFAQGAAASKPAPAVSAMPQMKMALGKVEAVTMADPAKGTKSEIVVKNESGTPVTILVKGTTTLYDAEMKAISLDKIMVGEMVRVKYQTTAEGVNEAASVHVRK